MTATEARIARLEAEAGWLRSLNVEAEYLEGVARGHREKETRWRDAANDECRKAYELAESAAAVRGRANLAGSLSRRVEALEAEAFELRESAATEESPS